MPSRKSFTAFLLLVGASLLSARLSAQASIAAVEGGFGVFAPGCPDPVLFLPFDPTRGSLFLEGERFVPKVRFSRGSFFFRKKNVRTERSLSIKTANGNRLLGLLGENLFELTVEMKADSILRLRITFSGDAERFDAVRLWLGKTPGERFLGLGEQASHVELTGKKVPLWVEEQGIGRGDRPITGWMRLFRAAGGPFASLCPIPVVNSTVGRTFHVHGSERMEFDFSENERWGVCIWTDSIAVDVYLHQTPLARLEAFAAENGRPPALPDWLAGCVLGVQGGPEAVEQKVAVLENAGADISAVWIQDWVGRRKTPFGSQLWWYWQADSVQYPGLRRWIQQLEGRGIHVLGYANPFLVDHGPLFEEARRKGFFVKKANGRDYAIKATGFKAYLLDFTRPDCAAWMKERLKNELLENGFSGWMADFGEWLPTDARLYDGRTGAEYHNQYPVDWARVNREALAESGLEGKAAFFSRSGFSGAARYTPFYWAGDQNTSWGKHDGIGSVVPSLLSSGLSGIAVNHGDVGGFTSVRRFPVRMVRSRELLLRWIELGAFSPVFRTHESLRPSDNLQVYSDTAVARFYARMARLRESIRPELLRAYSEATERGWPVARHLWLHYPEDPECIGLQNQFLLGSDLLVAPVVEAGAESVRVYFPGGRWRHILTEEIVDEKGWKTISAPLGTPAVFRRISEGR
jgi:alpha-glucosidase